MALEDVDSYIEHFLHPSITERIVADVALHNVTENSRQEILERLGYTGRQTIAGSNYIRFGLLVRMGVLKEWPVTAELKRLTYSVDQSSAEVIADYYSLKIESMRSIVEALRNQ